jgi:hypothetical protein
VCNAPQRACVAKRLLNNSIKLTRASVLPPLSCRAVPRLLQPLEGYWHSSSMSPQIHA